MSGDVASQNNAGQHKSDSELSELSESSESGSSESSGDDGEDSREQTGDSNIHPLLRDPAQPLTPPRFVRPPEGLLINEAAAGTTRSGQLREEHGQRSGPSNEPSSPLASINTQKALQAHKDSARSHTKCRRKSSKNGSRENARPSKVGRPFSIIDQRFN